MPPSSQHSRDGRMGSIRSHEYQCEVAVGTQRTTIPQPVSEIRVDSVLTLDRAASPNRITTATRGTPAEGYLLVTIDKSLQEPLRGEMSVRREKRSGNQNRSKMGHLTPF